VSAPGVGALTLGIHGVAPGADALKSGVRRVTPGADVLESGIHGVTPGADALKGGVRRVMPHAEAFKRGVRRVTPGVPEHAPRSRAHCATYLKYFSEKSLARPALGMRQRDANGLGMVPSTAGSILPREKEDKS
jgi:hypothetical protein